MAGGLTQMLGRNDISTAINLITAREIRLAVKTYQARPHGGIFNVSTFNIAVKTLQNDIKYIFDYSYFILFYIILWLYIQKRKENSVQMS